MVGIGLAGNPSLGQCRAKKAFLGSGKGWPKRLPKPARKDDQQAIIAYLRKRILHHP